MAKFTQIGQLIKKDEPALESFLIAWFDIWLAH